MADSRSAIARRIAVSRSASAVATSASRLMRAMSGTPHVGDVFVLVANFLDGERDHLQPHLVHVIGAGGAHAVGHHLGLLDDLFHRELPDNAAQVSFHHQPDQRFPVLRRLGEELLGRGQDRFRIGLHLDLRHCLHGDGNALLGVQVLLRSNIEGHQLQRQLTAVFHHGKDDRAVSLYDPRAAKSVHDQGLVRPGLAIEPGKDGGHEHDRRYRRPGDDEYFGWYVESHKNLLEPSK